MNKYLSLCLVIITCSIVTTPKRQFLASRETPATPTIVTLTAPPSTVADLLDDFVSSQGLRKQQAVTKLATMSEAEPYLRAYCASANGRKDLVTSNLFALLIEARAKRNMTRIKEWAKEGRYDFVVDAGLHLYDPKDVNQLCDLLFDFANKSRGIAEKYGGPAARYNLAKNMKGWDGQQSVKRFHSPHGDIDTDWLSHALVRGQSLRVTCRNCQDWLILTREELKGIGRSSQFELCYIFHNGDVSFDNLMSALVVCDGDIEVINSVDLTMSTVIARGSIQSQKGLKFHTSTLFAQGDITAKGSDTSVGLLVAGGKVNVPRTRNSVDSAQRIEKAGVKDNPFPVRFFETADAGVECEFKNNTLTITKLTPGSALTKYGIKEGDVITKLNDKVIASANDFRRELRYTIVLEAGIFHITRAKEKLTRVVYFKNGIEK